MSKKSFLLWGQHSVAQMLEKNPQDLVEIWFRDGQENAATAELKTRCGELGVTPQPASKQTLDRMCNNAAHQGVVARRLAPELLDLEGLLDELTAASEAPLLLALDKVQDPQNLGACLRVADAAGADAVIMLKDGAAPLSGVVAKAASGALDSVRLVACTNLARALRAIKSADVWIIGASESGSMPYFEADFAAPSCLVMGAEGTGLRRLTASLCDVLVAIPMHGSVSSLNVATATAVCLFEATRQREKE